MFVSQASGLVTRNERYKGVKNEERTCQTVHEYLSNEKINQVMPCCVNVCDVCVYEFICPPRDPFP